MSLYERVYKKHIELHGDKDNSTIKCLNNYAFTYMYSGNNTKALELFELVYKKRKEILTDDHPDTIKVKDIILGLKWIVD